MKYLKYSITTFFILTMLAALFTGCSSDEQGYTDINKFNFQFEETESGNLIINEKEVLIPALEKALLSRII